VEVKGGLVPRAERSEDPRQEASEASAVEVKGGLVPRAERSEDPRQRAERSEDPR